MSFPLLPRAPSLAPSPAPSPDSIPASADLRDVLAVMENDHGVKVRRAVSGGTCTTIGVGGTLDYLIEPENTELLSQILRLLNAAGVRAHVLGFGSNVLLPDAGLRSLVIRLGKGFRYWKVEGESVLVGGAMPLMTLSREIAGSGRRGLEFAGGIPGSFGGAVFMNAGAHGGEMAQILEEVELVLADGRVVCRSAVDLEFAYRHSALQRSTSRGELRSIGVAGAPNSSGELAGAIVTRARLRLEHDDPRQIARRTRTMLDERRARQPLAVPSLGSVFRNPEAGELRQVGELRQLIEATGTATLFAGALIEQMGLKGVVCGGAVISEKHANWIVSPARRARAIEFLALVELCEASALHRFGVKLTREFRRFDDADT